MSGRFFTEINHWRGFRPIPFSLLFFLYGLMEDFSFLLLGFVLFFLLFFGQEKWKTVTSAAATTVITVCT